MTVHLPNGTVDAQGQGSVDLGWQREVGFLLPMPRATTE